MYLRQQRRQLDESRHLLERLEEQQRRMAAAGSSGRGGVETAQSGTLPSRTATSGGQVSSAPVRQWSPFLLSLSRTLHLHLCLLHLSPLTHAYFFFCTAYCHTLSHTLTISLSFFCHMHKLLTISLIPLHFPAPSLRRLLVKALALE